jgi:hypothetical protein
MTIFVSDTFTGSAGLLTAHTGEIGGWTSDSSWYNNPANAKLSGTGVLYSVSNGATILSNAIAPGMDFYMEMFLDTAAKTTDGASVTRGLDFWFHCQPDFTPDPRQHRLSVSFDKDASHIYAGAWADSPYDTALAAYKDANSNIKLRIESDLTGNTVRVYINDVLVQTYTGAQMYAGSKPVVPGYLRMELNNDGTPTGPTELAITSLELGTLGPPPAFWTQNRLTTEVA